MSRQLTMPKSAADTGEVEDLVVLAEPGASPPSATAPASLRSLAIAGSFWTLVSHGAGQMLRLISNVCLTALLAPELFGIIGIVHVLSTALHMFSDVGLNAAVVFHKRGNDPDFIDTAWTMQVIRGVFLWLATCLIAWPAAVFYDLPILLWLMPVVGITSMITGFRSSAGFILTRRLQVKPLVWRHITAQAVSLIVMLIVAIWTRSIWVLVVGQFVLTTADVVLSFTIIKEARPRFRWDRAAVHDLYRFGRWIFVGTAITFLLQYGDRAILGKLISEAELGVYLVAALMARAPIEILLRLNAQVLFPMYSRSADESRASLRRRLVRARIAILFALLPITIALSIGGEALIHLLYSRPYHGAGWMLQILAIGASMTIINSSASSAILAVGDSFQHMVNEIARGMLLIAAMTVGWQVGQLEGLLIGMAVSKVLEYPVLAYALNRYQVWVPAVDFAAIMLTATITGLGLWIIA